MDLDELLAESDFVSLSASLNDSSYHLIGTRELDAMKPTAVLVNTARGPIVDESALVRALGSGSIAGAALDVFEEEPLPAGSPLHGMKNVLLSPHNAFNTTDEVEFVHENTVNMLIEALREPTGSGLAEG